MKVTIKDVEGLESLLGKRVTLFCCRYIYTGELVGVSDVDVKLTDCGIVYETGHLDSSEWEEYKKTPNDLYICRQSIESFGIIK